MRGVQVEVDSSEEGRITGANKQLQDQRVHEMLSEDVETPPPPYSPPEAKSHPLSQNSLSGERWQQGQWQSLFDEIIIVCREVCT